MHQYEIKPSPLQHIFVQVVYVCLKGEARCLLCMPPGFQHWTTVLGRLCLILNIAWLLVTTRHLLPDAIGDVVEVCSWLSLPFTKPHFTFQHGMV